MLNKVLSMSLAKLLLKTLPILCLSAQAFAQSPQVCDVDVDGDIDRADISLIFAARNQPATGPDDPRDADGNGIITVLDGRQCVLMCTLPRCVSPPSNTAPVANAGTDQTVDMGDTVMLNGSGSSDDDGDALTFAWNIFSAPVGSTAMLSNPTNVMPTFVADVAGDYVIELIVNDGTENSVPDEVVVITAPGNTAPVADAGPDQSAVLGDTVDLDGSSSFDVDGDSLTFAWTISNLPTGSTANLSVDICQWFVVQKNNVDSMVLSVPMRSSCLLTEPD